MLLLCIQTNRSGTRPLFIQLYFVLVEIRLHGLHIQIIKSCTTVKLIKYLAQLKIIYFVCKKKKEEEKIKKKKRKSQFFTVFPTQQFNSGKKGTRSKALLNSKWAVLRFLVTDSCHATALLHKFCTWFLAFICEFVLFVDVEQHSLSSSLLLYVLFYFK